MPKVLYGLCNVHYAKLTEVTDPETGVVTTQYSTVKQWPGAVNLQLDPNGNPIIFSADNSAYYTISNNKGYEGSLEVAMIPDDVRLDVVGNKADKKGFIVESDKDKVDYFALMFEINTDENPTRYVFYKCSLSQRPSVASKTVDVSGDLEIGTETVNLKCMPMASYVEIDGIQCHLVKAFTGEDVDSTAYNNFYTDVYIPEFSEES